MEQVPHPFQRSTLSSQSSSLTLPVCALGYYSGPTVPQISLLACLVFATGQNQLVGTLEFSIAVCRDPKPCKIIQHDIPHPPMPLLSHNTCLQRSLLVVR